MGNVRIEYSTHRFHDSMNILFTFQCQWKKKKINPNCFLYMVSSEIKIYIGFST